MFKSNLKMIEYIKKYIYDTLQIKNEIDVESMQYQINNSLTLKKQPTEEMIHGCFKLYNETLSY